MLQQFPVFSQIMHQKIKCVIADFSFPVLGVLCTGLVLIILTEVNSYGVVLIVDIPAVIHP